MNADEVKYDSAADEEGVKESKEDDENKTRMEY
jgi:hypothetical protein